MAIIVAGLREIAQEVVGHLPGYTLAPFDASYADSDDAFQESRCRLTRSEASIGGQGTLFTYIIRLHWTNFRQIVIEGDWPRSRFDMNRRFPDEERRTRAITVVLDTTPEHGKVSTAAEQIARDIQRRFLPYYEIILNKGIEERDRHDVEEQAARDFAAELAKLSNGSVEPDRPSWFRGGKVDAGSFQGRVRGDGRVDFSFRVLTGVMERQVIHLVGEEAIERGEQRDWNTPEMHIRGLAPATARILVQLFAAKK